ncbi:MAG: hypothetical protein AB1625_04095 [Acidobacteriota bacterium]
MLAELALAAVATAAQKPPAATPTLLPIRGVRIDLPSRERAAVKLLVPAPKGAMPQVAAQALAAGDVAIPLAGTPVLAAESGVGHVSFEVNLSDAPEGVLGLDPNRLPLRWEGLDARGRSLLVAQGVVDLGDPGEVEVPIRRVQDLYTKVGRLSLSPGPGGLSVRLLLGLHNPFAFDVVVKGLAFQLAVDGRSVMTGARPGFRLRGRQSSDVLIEQDVPLAELAGGAAAVLGGATAELTGHLTVRTPNGDRYIPLQVGGRL